MPDNPVLSNVDQDFLKDCAEFDQARLEAYALYESYYDGEQSVKLTDRTKKWLEQHGGQVKWCENFAEPIVDVLAERLRVSGFGVFAGEEKRSIMDRLTRKPKPEDVTTQLHSYIDNLLEQNGFDAMQDVVHTNCLVKGDVVLVAYVKDGKPRLTWNPPENWKFVYSEETPDEVSLAIKVWTTKEKTAQNPEGNEITRMNLYWPERIEKYYRAGRDGEWGRWQTEGEPWPAPWVDDGKPLGISDFQLKYKSLGRSYGRSRIKAAIPFQDALNKQVVDLMMVLDQMGWPQRYFFGADVSQAAINSFIGSYLTAPQASEVKAGQWDPADTKGILDSIESTLSRLARRCRVPLHLITGGDMPSGESLKASESGLVNTARLTQTEWGAVWEAAIKMLVKLGQVYGDAPKVDLDTLTIRCEWADPESRNDKEEAETALIKQSLGVSQDTLLTELGYDPEEEREKRAQEMAESQERQEMFFNRGNAPGAAGEEPEEPKMVGEEAA